jgi:hypothetical protein
MGHFLALLGPDVVRVQRQSTLDCRYLTLLCDNLKKRMFLKNFFCWHYFGNLLCFSNYAHHSTILQPNYFIMDWKIRLLGQKMIFLRNIPFFKLSHNRVRYRQSSVDCLWAWCCTRSSETRVSNWYDLGMGSRRRLQQQPETLFMCVQIFLWSPIIKIAFERLRDTIKTRLKILPVLTREHYTSLLHWV